MLGIAYLVVLGNFLLYVGWTPELVRIADDLGMSYSNAGLLSAITALSAGFTLPLAGSIGNRFGSKSVTIAGLIIGVAGQLLFSVADTTAFALVARAITGVGVGLLFVGPYSLAADWFHAAKRSGTALGTMLTSDGVGALVAIYLFAFVLTSAGWRGGLKISAVILVVILVIVITLLRDVPKPTEAPTAAISAHGEMSLQKALTNRNVLCAACFYVGSWGIFGLVATWVPSILIEDAGWSPEGATFFTSLYVLAGAIPALTFGLLSDRLGRRRIVIVSSGLATAVCVAVVGVCLSTGTYALVAIALPILGLLIYPGATCSLSLAAVSVGNQSSLTNGLIFGSAFVVGGFAYPYALGIIKDATGSYSLGFFLAALTSFALCFIVPIFLAADVATDNPSEVAVSK